ncbi:7 transmembrane receptor (rhodopsin family) protein [Brugia pahangi]
MKELEATRHPTLLIIIYSAFYSAVFLLGLLGNTFAVLSVILHPQLRSSTDYLISSLATADLLIILFCLPTTLLNNLLTEWQLGAIGCKMSTWINSTTSCASIFTLVAVTADRYLAICHTMKYAVWDSRWTLYVIAGIWMLSGILAAPTLAIYDEILFTLDPPNGTMVARLCIATQDETLNFIIVNLLLAFTIPFILISALYTRIFITVSNHRSLAVNAKIRDERVKLRVAQMMFTVIIVFALCWLPLHGIYSYFFLTKDYNTSTFQFASQSEVSSSISSLSRPTMPSVNDMNKHGAKRKIFNSYGLNHIHLRRWRYIVDSLTDALNLYVISSLYHQLPSFQYLTTRNYTTTTSF